MKNQVHPLPTTKLPDHSKQRSRLAAKETHTQAYTPSVRVLEAEHHLRARHIDIASPKVSIRETGWEMPPRRHVTTRLQPIHLNKCTHRSLKLIPLLVRVLQEIKQLLHARVVLRGRGHVGAKFPRSIYCMETGFGGVVARLSADGNV